MHGTNIAVAPVSLDLEQSLWRDLSTASPTACPCIVNGRAQ